MHRRDVAFHALAYRLGFAHVRNGSKYVLRFKDLANAHRNGLPWHVIECGEPSFPKLLAAAVFVQRDDEIRSLGLEICGWVIESEVAIFTYAGEREVNGIALDLTVEFRNHLLRVARTVDQVELANAHFVDEPFAEIPREAGRVVFAESGVLIQVKHLDFVPRNSWKACEHGKHVELRCPSGCDQPGVALPRNSFNKESSGLRGNGLCERGLVRIHFQMHCRPQMRNERIQNESSTRSACMGGLGGLFLMFALTLEVAAQTLPPDDLLRVLPATAEGPSTTPYLAAQVDRAWALDIERMQRWSGIRSEAQLLAEQHRLRERLLRSIGDLPEQKTPLRPRISGSLQAEGFHVEKLIFESLPHFYVTALVYVPEGGKAKHPAVLVPAGHAADGKVHYQELAQRLVRSGYVVLSWDPLGQGERSQFWESEKKHSRYNLISGEHAVLGRMALLRGQSLARYEVWDGVRALDYLLTRNDVDAKRIAITGTSGGGFQAAMIGALDTRISVIIPSCYITSMPMRVANRIARDPDSDPEQDPPGFLSDGIDHAGLLLLMYPRRVLVAAATLDFFPVEGTRKTFAEVRALYARFGHGGAVRMVESYNEHQYSLANQLAALQFIAASWQLERPKELPPVVPLDRSQLLCTHSGQVMTEFADAVPLQTALARVPVVPVSIGALRDLYVRTRSAAPARQQRDAACPGAWEEENSAEFTGMHIEKYLLRYGDALTMPVLYISRAGTQSRRAVLLPRKTGDITADEWQNVEHALRDENAVVLFSFRAEGENAMRYRVRGDDPTLNPGTWADEYANPLSSVLADMSYNAMLLGRPYLLDRIEDVELAARFAREHLGVREIRFYAGGDAFFQWAANGILHLPANDATPQASWSQKDDGPIEDTVPTVLLQRNRRSMY